MIDKHMLLVAFLLLVLLSNAAFQNGLTFTDDASCQQAFERNVPTAGDFGSAMQTGFWGCAKSISILLQKKGTDIRNLFDAESRNIQREIQNLKTAIESSLPVKNIQPAFQWAQSGNDIFINVKFAHKIDAPATLNVEVSNVSMTENKLVLSATDGRKIFTLDLEFLHGINPDESTYSMASVGRMTFTIKKLEAKRWVRLLKQKSKATKHMHLWWDVQEKYVKELEKLDDEETDKDVTKKSSVKNDSIAKDNSKDSSDSNNTETVSSKSSSAEDLPIIDPKEQEVALEKKRIEEEKKEKIKQIEEEARAKKKGVDLKAKQEKDSINIDFEAKKEVIEKEAEEKKSTLMSEL